MNKSQIVFKAVDIVCKKSQNPYNYDNIFCIKDIPYSDIDEKMTCGDLYFDPLRLKDGKKHPIILNIHGGGFVMGDKRYRKCLSEYYADRGYYVYNINYRMPPSVDIMGCIKDCADALNYIPVLAQTYNIDVDKIVVTGDSSGAYLAAYLGVLKFNPDLPALTNLPEITAPIAALILHSGPYDMKKMMGEHLFGLSRELGSMLVGFDLTKDMTNIIDFKYFDYISPIDFVNDAWSPVFLSWSDSDVICTDQGRPMALKLMEHSPKVATFYADGLTLGHCFHLTMKKNISMKCIDNSIEFANDVISDIDKAKREKAS